jgi:hypothetical protein
MNRGIGVLVAITTVLLLLFSAAQSSQGQTVQTVSNAVNNLLQKFEAVSDGTQTTDDPPVIHVVDRDNKDSWKIDVGPTGVVTFENTTCDTGETPLPPGALHLVVGEGDSYARLRATRYHRTYLRDLTQLNYWTCDQTNNGQQLPYIILDINWNGGNSIDDLIFFEPAYQNAVEGGVCGAGSSQSLQMLLKWQYWDALRTDPTTNTYRACYWAASTDGTGVCSEGEFVCPLSVYIAMHPNAAIVNVDGNHGGVQIVHGFASSQNTFNGWVDAFTIGRSINGPNGTHNTITYDYQQP